MSGPFIREALKLRKCDAIAIIEYRLGEISRQLARQFVSAAAIGVFVDQHEQIAIDGRLFCGLLFLHNGETIRAWRVRTCVAIGCKLALANSHGRLIAIAH
jgi:hypothetical protein